MGDACDMARQGETLSPDCARSNSISSRSDTTEEYGSIVAVEDSLPLTATRPRDVLTPPLTCSPSTFPVTSSNTRNNDAQEPVATGEDDATEAVLTDEDDAMVHMHVPVDEDDAMVHMHMPVDEDDAVEHMPIDEDDSWVAASRSLPSRVLLTEGEVERIPESWKGQPDPKDKQAYSGRKNKLAAADFKDATLSALDHGVVPKPAIHRQYPRVFSRVLSSIEASRRNECADVPFQPAHTLEGTLYRLLIAIMHGNMTEGDPLGVPLCLQYLEESGGSVDDRTKHGEFPLLTACAYGQYAVASWLLDMRADVNTTDRFGTTGLIEVATRGCTCLRGIHQKHIGSKTFRCRTEICRLLLDSNADITMQIRTLVTDAMPKVIPSATNKARTRISRTHSGGLVVMKDDLEPVQNTIMGSIAGTTAFMRVNVSSRKWTTGPYSAPHQETGVPV
eukprot:GEMP01032377.1.p1 GENE.GEMP01032377.1~~GEMP01032377.1.p1  ORF type:complete len:448 (+),score=97.89 GEMP01032377.1:117-1460(+)